MSCVVGVVGKDAVYIGSDSIVTIGDSVVYTKHKKVVATKNIVFGVVGTIDIVPIMREVLSAPEFVAEDSISSDKMMSISDKFRLLAEDKGYVHENTSEGVGIPYFEGEVLLSNGSGLFHLHSTFSMSEVSEGFAAIGQGGDTALGYLRCVQMNDGLDSEIYSASYAIVGALGSAFRYNIWVRPPYHIYRHGFDGSIEYDLIDA